MFFAAAASILGVKNLSPTQTQAIGYTNINSDLHFALGLCISLVVFKNYFKIELRVITMVKYVFCCSSFNSWSKKPVIHINLSHWLYKHSQWPSVSFWIEHHFGCSQKHVKMRLLVITMVKYVFYCSSNKIIGVKNLSPTQT